MTLHTSVVPTSDQLLPTALELARQVIKNSPSAVQLTKLALLETLRRGHDEVLDVNQRARLKTHERQLGKGIEQSTLSTILRDEFDEVFKGHDSREGLRSFSEVCDPSNVNSSYIVRA